MCNSTLFSLNLATEFSAEQKIAELEKLVASDTTPVILDGETRAEIVQTVARRMERLSLAPYFTQQPQQKVTVRQCRRPFPMDCNE